MTRFGPDLSRRALLIGAAQISTAAVAYAATPRRSSNRLARASIESVMPRRIDDWEFVSTNGVVTTTEKNELDGYDQQLKRVYASPDQPRIMLLLAYGSTQGGSLQLHRPETCYPGQGFGVSAFRDVDLDLGGRRVAARALTAQRDDRTERLLYWTRIADSFPRSTAGEYRAILTSVLAGSVPDGILVRVSTLDGDAAIADKALARFAVAMVAAMPEQARTLLIGTLPTVRARVSG